MLYALTSEGKSRELLKLAAQFAVKRILDYIVAGLGVLLLGPLMLGIALLIRLDSRGPILFRQQRLGLGGKPFRLWKFRTMVVDAEDRLGGLEHLNESRGGVLFKIRHDPRVTRIGRLLRRTSLDELPQLLNVLQGHMSLVGPRPLPLRDCERLQEIDGQQFQGRHSVLPGLTGPWQVGGRSETGIEHMINLDLEYIDTWSLWRDLQLIGRTIIVVAILSGRLLIQRPRACQCTPALVPESRIEPYRRAGPMSSLRRSATAIAAIGTRARRARLWESSRGNNVVESWAIRSGAGQTHAGREFARRGHQSRHSPPSPPSIRDGVLRDTFGFDGVFVPAGSITGEQQVPRGGALKCHREGRSW